jgi:hypothetical protein
MNLILLESPHLELHLSYRQFFLIPVLIVYKIHRRKTMINSYLHLYALIDFKPSLNQLNL